MLYTTYFSNLQYIQKDDVVMVITLYPPKWLDQNKYPVIEYFAPSPELFESFHNRKDISFDEFEEQFIRETLENNPKIVDLVNLSKVVNVILVCYEKDGTSCHRQIIARWLKKHFNVEWKELLYGEPN